MADQIPKTDQIKEVIFVPRIPVYENHPLGEFPTSRGRLVAMKFDQKHPNDE